MEGKHQILAITVFLLLFSVGTIVGIANQVSSRNDNSPNLSELWSKMSELSDTAVAQERQIQDLEYQVDSLKYENRDLDDQIGDLEDKISDLEYSVRRLNY